MTRFQNNGVANDLLYLIITRWKEVLVGGGHCFDTEAQRCCCLYAASSLTVMQQ